MDPRTPAEESVQDFEGGLIWITQDDRLIAVARIAEEIQIAFDTAVELCAITVEELDLPERVRQEAAAAIRRHTK